MNITASIQDDDFYNNPQAVYVTGYFGDPWLAEYGGVGPSPAPYSMKALMVDGIVYRPVPVWQTPELTPPMRRWVPIAAQPDAAHVRPAKKG